MKINNIVIDKIKSKEDFFRFIDELNLQGDVFVIKPNWVDGTEGSFTEAGVLEFLFDYLKNKKIFIIESYTLWRNQPFIERGEEEIPSDKGNLIDAKARWGWIKQQDNWFLENKGMKFAVRKI